MLEIGGSTDQALDVIVETGYSRIPMYEGTIDSIVGILNAQISSLTCGITATRAPS